MSSLNVMQKNVRSPSVQMNDFCCLNLKRHYLVCDCQLVLNELLLCQTQLDYHEDCSNRVCREETSDKADEASSSTSSAAAEGSRHFTCKVDIG